MLKKDLSHQGIYWFLATEKITASTQSPPEEERNE
jgi:hypothetical protein